MEWEMFPSVPHDHLGVLLVFMTKGFWEVAGQLPEPSDFFKSFSILCQDYTSGRVQVKRAGSEWQVWQRGELTTWR